MKVQGNLFLLTDKNLRNPSHGTCKQILQRSVQIAIFYLRVCHFAGWYFQLQRIQPR